MLASAIREVGRIQPMPPPVFAGVMARNTRIIGRWHNTPYEAHVPALDQHVIVGHLSGSSPGYAKIDGRLYVTQRQAGSITVAPKGHDSYRVNTGHYEVTCLFLDEERLRTCANDVFGGRPVELFDRVGLDDPKAFALLQLLSDEASAPERTSRLFMEQLIDALCLHLIRAHSAWSDAPALPRRGLADWQLKRLGDFVAENLDAEIELQQLADLIGMSRFHFCTAFRKATGRTPHAWLTAQRMTRARALLADPAQSITDVALAVGYQTPSAFAASFRKLCGVSPSEYRHAL